MIQIPVQLISILRQLRNYLQNTYQNQLDKVILFGSQARGDVQEDSDIDILIVLKDPFDDHQETQKSSF
jgi:predicted nucleotidyltransferase